MVKRKFEDSVGAEAVGFSHSDFGLVVQALHNAARNELLSAEIIEDEFPVLTQGASNLLHGLDAGAHGLSAPLVEELASPRGRVVIPKLLKGFLEKVRPNGFQIVAEEIAQSEMLFDAEIVATAE